MDFVRIKDGAKLENCIVCKDAIIGEKVEMRDCEIGGKFEVVSDRECDGRVNVRGVELTESRSQLR